ncbi:MAG: DinB family protein [Chitinophagaceae bacterium]
MQSQDFIIKQVLEAWYIHIKRVDSLLRELSDEQLLSEIAPGKNTGLYLVGHLAAVHDSMLPLLDLDKKLHPELEEVFIKNPDKSGLQKPTVDTVKKNWKEINDQLEGYFSKMRGEDWLKRHMSISEEDFIKEPHRNKLNVLLSRTNHVANHFGQLLLLKKKHD